MDCSELVPLYWVAGGWFLLVWVFTKVFGGSDGLEIRRIQIQDCTFFVGLVSTLYWAGTIDFLCVSTQELAPARTWNLARNFVFFTIQLCFVSMLTRRFNSESKSMLLLFGATFLSHLFLAASIYFEKDSNYCFLTSWSLQLFVYISIWSQNWTIPPSDTSFTKRCYFVALIYWNVVYIILFVGPWITGRSPILFQEITIVVIDCLIAAPTNFYLVRYSWAASCTNDLPLRAGDFSHHSPREQAKIAIDLHTIPFHQ